ncbi:amino acid ABC transporter substrate-binding protein [Rhodoferax sp.]|uniref:amino acid ABC transporter substrate-binding protein n=1 Tax=Rhodoferax sp. TaxID=50421 RepID=UPI00261CB406|nr:amino acid ABC transporter substrate-binding protein [Rhodoferax sp.]MDD2923559.1 amino acid ABC transporter substrate-binding protein [Rhodoferax sp.]
MKRTSWEWVWLMSLMAWGPAVLAQAQPPASAPAPAPALVPVLERIAGGGKLVIAHRESSIPFSYLDANKKPIGYAVDLCLKIAQAVQKKLELKNLPVDYLQVTPANRIDMVVQGKADLECGSTTNNAERRQKVAFTVPHFITGARLLVKANSPVQRMEELQGKRLVSTKGTTPLKAAIQANRERLMNITIVEAPDHAKAVEMVEKGEAEAFVMDDVLLYGLAANRPNPGALKVVGKFLTTEPLAIMLPKNDPDFKKVVDEEMRRLVFSKEIFQIYDKWFMKPIVPSNTALAMPVSYLLRDFWKYPSDQVPF